MPDLIIHQMLSKILFDDPYTKAHKFFDAGRIICPTVIHRLFPPHDLCSAIAYSCFKNDLRIILVYIQHIIQDALQLLFFPVSITFEKLLIDYLNEKNLRRN